MMITSMTTTSHGNEKHAIIDIYVLSIGMTAPYFRVRCIHLQYLSRLGVPFDPPDVDWAFR